MERRWLRKRLSAFLFGKPLDRLEHLMPQTPTVRVDAHGRVTLPQRFRQALGIEPGDEVEIAIQGQHFVVRATRRENPFDVLAAYAIEEHRAGRTQNLRDFSAANGIDLDG